MNVVAAFASLSMVVVSLWYLVSRRPRQGRSMRCMPGPSPSQLMAGNLTQITRPDTHRQLTQWANEFGRLYKIRVLAKPIVICTDPVLAQRVLGAGKDSFPKAAFAYDGAIDISSINSHRNLFTHLDQSKHWQNARKAIAPAFSAKAIKSYFPIIRSKGEQLSRAILTIAGKPEDNTAKVEIHAAVLRASFDIIGQAGLKLEWDTLADLTSMKQGSSQMPKEPSIDNIVGLSALHAVDGVLEEFSLRMADISREYFQKLFPFLKSSKEVQGKIKAIQDAYRNILGLMRKQGPPEGFSIGEALLRLEDPDNPDQALPDDRLMSELAPMLIGGYETSASAIQWVLYDIANNPEVQTKLKAELKSTGLLCLPTLAGSRPLEMDDLALPYFNAVVKESMRLHLITGSTATVRQAPEDMEFGGYFLPKGTALWVPLYSMANSVHNFERPSSFWPERWQDQQATPSRLSCEGPSLDTGHPTPAGNSALPSKSHLPFSQGPRDCIGQNLGNVVVRTLVLSILRRFWLAVDVERMGSPQEVEANQLMALTVQHPRGFHFLISQHGS